MMDMRRMKAKILFMAFCEAVANISVRRCGYRVTQSWGQVWWDFHFICANTSGPKQVDDFL